MIEKVMSYKEVAEKLKIDVRKLRLVVDRAEFSRFRCSVQTYSKKRKCYIRKKGIIFNKEFLVEYFERAN